MFFFSEEECKRAREEQAAVFSPYVIEYQKLKQQRMITDGSSSSSKDGHYAANSPEMGVRMVEGNSVVEVDEQSGQSESHVGYVKERGHGEAPRVRKISIIFRITIEYAFHYAKSHNFPFKF